MEIGQSITLQLDRKNNKGSQNLISKIIELDEEYIYISYPTNTSTGKTTMLLDGLPFTVIFRKQDEIHYSFTTRVSLRKKLNNIPVLGLEKPKEEDFKKIQRRNYLRIEAVLDISVQIVDYHQHIPFTTTTVDISGGGAAIVVPKNIKLEVDQIVHVWIVLPFSANDYQYINASAKVLRIIEKERGLKIAPLEFISIKNKDRDEIVRYCFQKQVKKQKV